MSKTIEINEDIFNSISDMAIKMVSVLEVLEAYTEDNMDLNNEIANIYIVIGELKQISVNLRSKVLNVV